MQALLDLGNIKPFFLQLDSLWWEKEYLLFEIITSDKRNKLYSSSRLPEPILLLFSHFTYNTAVILRAGFPPEVGMYPSLFIMNIH